MAISRAERHTATQLARSSAPATAWSCIRKQNNCEQTNARIVSPDFIPDAYQEEIRACFLVNHQVLIGSPHHVAGSQRPVKGLPGFQSFLPGHHAHPQADAGTAGDFVQFILETDQRSFYYLLLITFYDIEL